MFLGDGGEGMSLQGVAVEEKCEVVPGGVNMESPVLKLTVYSPASCFVILCLLVIGVG
jgi:hypothetical protein